MIESEALWRQSNVFRTYHKSVLWICERPVLTPTSGGTRVFVSLDHLQLAAATLDALRLRAHAWACTANPLIPRNVGVSASRALRVAEAACRTFRCSFGSFLAAFGG